MYDGLAVPAQEYVRAIAAQAVGTPQLDIQAHTVAQIRAGIRPIVP